MEGTEGPKRLRLPFFYPPLSPWEKKWTLSRHRFFGETDDLATATTMVDMHRHLDCPAYDACLDQTAKARWLGFSCRECSRFKERGPRPASRLEAALARTPVTLTIQCPGGPKA